MKALVSIHDVMPHTLERVERILEWLTQRGVPPVTLLVVPGLPWESEKIERLRELAATGHELAAHGWFHHTTPRRLYHRIHAALISRNVAEHLALDSKSVLELMTRSKNWFAENDLPLPEFYVPPAWALGPISKDDLAQVPYQMIETTRGLIHLQPPRPINRLRSTSYAGRESVTPPSQRRGAFGENLQSKDNELLPCQGEVSADRADGGVHFQKLPLTGYEADTAFRECFLRRWNAAQAKSAQRRNVPLRISIHPDDLDLRIADQMDSQIRVVESFLPYSGF